MFADKKRAHFGPPKICCHGAPAPPALRVGRDCASALSGVPACVRVVVKIVVWNVTADSTTSKLISCVTVADARFRRARYDPIPFSRTLKFPETCVRYRSPKIELSLLFKWRIRSLYFSEICSAGRAHLLLNGFRNGKRWR